MKIKMINREINQGYIPANPYGYISLGTKYEGKYHDVPYLTHMAINTKVNSETNDGQSHIKVVCLKRKFKYYSFEQLKIESRIFPNYTLAQK